MTPEEEEAKYTEKELLVMIRYELKAMSSSLAQSVQAQEKMLATMKQFILALIGLVAATLGVKFL